jgi:glyoxylase-like metal-dependent hydrolase (beta-lactamase superfamily II)
MRIQTLIAANPGPYTLDGTRTYILNDRAVLDPGPALDDHIETILSCCPRIESIFLTHRHADHAGAVEMLRERSGARVYAPAGVPAAELVDHTVESGETYDVGGDWLKAIGTPGHTAEHVCYLSEDGSLFTGDTILGEGTTTIFPPDGDMGDYLDSLRKLRDLRPLRIYPGHGPVRDDAVPLIDEYIAHRQMRERQIVQSLSDGPATPGELRRRIYPELHEMLHEAAELQMRAHLDLLIRRQKVTRSDDRYELR